MNQTIGVNITPQSFQPTLHYSQGDVGRVFVINVTDYDIPTGATVTCVATKPSGMGFTVSGTVSGNSVTFTSTAEMTDEWGRFPAEIRIASGNTLLGTANFLMIGEKDPHPASTIDGTQEELIPQLTLLVNRVEAAAESVHDLTVSATTLTAGSDATATYDSTNNSIAFGIPRGADGDVTRSEFNDLKSELTDETNARILLAGRMTTAEGDIDTLETHKVAQPLDEYNQPTDGTAGQSLRTKGDGTTEWADVGLPTDEQTAQAVSDWLDEHPEATTTVQDGSLTETKFSDALKLKAIKDYVTPQMFGAKGDGTTDDLQAINDAVSYATTNKMSLLFPKVENGYKVSSGVVIPSATNLIMESPIIYNGDGIALTLGSLTGTYNYVNVRVKVKSTSRSNSSIGVKLINMANCNIYIDYVWGFGTGAMLVGSGNGFSYNEIYIGIITNASVGLYLNPINGGWVNENNFFGGRIWRESASGIQTTGVVIGNDGTTNPNNNVFYKLCIESIEKGVQINYGYNNAFYNVRSENTTLVFECLNTSNNNVMLTGYGNTTYNGNYRKNYIASVTNTQYPLKYRYPVYDGSDFITSVAESENQYIVGENLFSYSNGALRLYTTGTREDGYIQLNNYNIGVAFYCRGDGTEEFVVNRQYISGAEGRVLVALFDENNTPIDGLIYFENDMQKTFVDSYVCYESTVNGSGTLIFKVPNGCKKVFIALFKTSKIVSWSIGSNIIVAKVPSAKSLGTIPTHTGAQGEFVSSRGSSDGLFGWVYKNGAWQTVSLT